MKIFFVLFFLLINLVSKAPNPDTRVRYALAYRSIYNLQVNNVRNADFSEENLRSYLYLKGVKNSRYIMAQFILESGWFKSEIFLENNNLAGMKLARVRETVATGESRGHAQYNSWADSVDDYLLWLEYYHEKGYDTSDYLLFLEAVGYAENPEYVKILIDVKNKNC